MKKSSNLPSSRLALLLAVAACLVLACGDARSPVEPSSIPAAPTPAPTPTLVPGQPSVMTGVVRSYGPLEPGTTVECQGRSTTTTAEGAYTLTGLLSGPSRVVVTYTYATPADGFVTDRMDVDVILEPGSNIRDFLVY